jgi:hypothetical protein
MHAFGSNRRLRPKNRYPQSSCIDGYPVQTAVGLANSLAGTLKHVDV